MVKKSKELDEQYKYFARKISNKIADIGIGIGLVLSMACFCIVMICYYFVPFKEEETGYSAFRVRLLEDLFHGIYAVLDFVSEGINNYVTNLPDFVIWCFLGIIAGIVIFFVFIALFWEEFEKEEEKKSDSEIWTEKEKKEKSDGSHIYEWKVRLVNSSPIDGSLRKSLSLDIEEILQEWGYVTEIKSEDITNEVPEQSRD